MYKKKNNPWRILKVTEWIARHLSKNLIGGILRVGSSNIKVTLKWHRCGRRAAIRFGSLEINRKESNDKWLRWESRLDQLNAQSIWQKNHQETSKKPQNGRQWRIESQLIRVCVCVCLSVSRWIWRCNRWKQSSRKYPDNFSSCVWSYYTFLFGFLIIFFFSLLLLLFFFVLYGNSFPIEARINCWKFPGVEFIRREEGRFLWLATVTHPKYEIISKAPSISAQMLWSLFHLTKNA